MKVRNGDDVHAIKVLLSEKKLMELRQAILKGRDVWFFRTPEEFRRAKVDLSQSEIEKCQKAFESGDQWVFVFRCREAKVGERSPQGW